MIFTPAKLTGACVLDLEPRTDERGFFARAWCRTEFEAHGLVRDFVQANTSYTRRKGTIRGMHYQVAPFEEAKLVRCTRGAIWDVMIDLRRESPTYLEWFGIELSAENRRQLYVPTGCAHGYQTLAGEAEVYYHVSAFYSQAAERGIRWSDPLFRIHWPEPDRAVSVKDDAWPDFQPEPGHQPGAATIPPRSRR